MNNCYNFTITKIIKNWHEHKQIFNRKHMSDQWRHKGVSTLLLMREKQMNTSTRDQRGRSVDCPWAWHEGDPAWTPHMGWNQQHKVPWALSRAPPPKHRVHTEHCWEWPSNNPPNHNKTTTRILFTSTSLAQIEKTGTIKWGQDVKSTDALYSSSNSAKWHNHTGNTLVVSYKLNIHLAYNSAFSFPPRNLLKRNENICSSQRPVQNALGRLIPNDLRRGKGRSKYSLLGEWFSLDHGLCASDKRIHCKTCRTKEVKDKSPECIVPLT